MKITYLFLRGYKPLHLNNLETIELKIEKDIQLIISSNGAGKSSLLRELTPMPAVRGDYRSNGYKEIHITHKNSNYILISDFSKGNKHSITQDEISINVNSTSTIQKELVEKIFNYTPLIQKILTGALKFTTMSPAIRREVLTAISPLKLDYATKIFNLAKIASRDTVGALNHVIEKSVNYRTNLNTLEYADDITETRDKLESSLNNLLKFTNQDMISPDIVLVNIETILSRLEKAKTIWSNFKFKHITEDWITDSDKLIEFIGILQGKLSVSKSLVDAFTLEFTSLNGAVNSVIDGSLSEDDLNDRIFKINKELESLNVTCFIENDHSRVINEINILKHKFSNILDNPVAVFNESTREQNKTELIFLTNEENSLKNNLSIVNKKLDHHKDESNSTICPRCELKFSLSEISLSESIKELENKYKFINQKLIEISDKLNKVKLLDKDIHDFELVYQNLKRISSETILPNAFWGDYPKLISIIESPIIIFSYLDLWHSNISIGLLKYNLIEELNNCKRALSLYNKYDGGVNHKLSKLEESIKTELINQKIIRSNLLNAKETLKTFKYYDEITKLSYKLLNDLDSQYHLLIDSTIQLDAKANCDIIYDRLAIIRQTLRKKESLESNIHLMGIEITGLNFKKKSLDLLIDSLSPNKGLIADQMLGFMNSYINEMNLISDFIWGYNLEIGQCSMDNGLLDYKFPLNIEDAIVSDISMGSTGQRDIIDLAFTMVMREYLNITFYPLYLDETGASFDESHRDALTSYIKMILETDKCSQIFMVNHYSSVHDALRNHDVIVLDDRNITTPDSFNKNVTFTYRE